MKTDSPIRRVQRIRHEIRIRDVVVEQVQHLSDHFARVTFSGDALVGFVSSSFDDHIKFIFNDVDGNEVKRDYTPRFMDAIKGQLVIDFALHEHGAATDWARRAKPGEQVKIAGPRGSMVLPDDFDWHVLVGDASALPAMARRLDGLPAGAKVTMISSVAQADYPIATAALLTYQVVPLGDELVAAVRKLVLPDGEGFVWCAGEGSVMARVRDVLLLERGLPKEQMKVAAYWKAGLVDFHERLE
jgi:NADPH-dependent ferric siderophore reductase